MFAIIRLGNQQFRVEPNTVIEANLTGKAEKDEFDIEQVLLIERDGKVEVGKPFLGSKVRAMVLRNFKDKKIQGFTYKRRKRIHRAWGHRQQKQKIKILSIA